MQHQMKCNADKLKQEENLMEPAKHSGLGIASFIMSIVSFIFVLLLFGTAGYIQTTTPGGMDGAPGAALIVGIFFFICMFLTLLSLALGIAGLFQKLKKKIFAILGTIFSGLIIAMTAILMVIGLVAS